MGLIDTLSAGFDRTAKRLWLILIPVLLDLGVWLGPRLSLNGLMQSAIRLLPDGTELGTQYAQAIELSRSWLAEVGQTTNLLTLLSMRVLGLPGLSGSLVPPAAPATMIQRTIDIQSGLAALGVMLLLLFLGLLVGCGTLSLMAADARDGQLSPGYALGVAWRSWVRLTFLLSGTAVLVFGVVVGASMIAGLIGVVSMQLAAWILTFLAWTLIILSIYGGLLFYFTSRAVILDDKGLLSSMRSALHVLQRNLMASLGFILIVNLLHVGLLYIWRLLAVNTIGMIAAIVGNAYVNTGLVMASFIFYRERLVATQNAAPKKVS